MSTRISPEAYLGVPQVSINDTSQPQPVVNNYYTQPAQTQSLATTPEGELAEIKHLIIGLAIGLALGIAIYSMLRDTK